MLVPRLVPPPSFPRSNGGFVLLLRPLVSLPHPRSQLVGIRGQQGLAAQPATRGTAGQHPVQAGPKGPGSALVALNGGLWMSKHSDESGESEPVKLWCWDSGIFVNEAECKFNGKEGKLWGSILCWPPPLSHGPPYTLTLTALHGQTPLYQNVPRTRIRNAKEIHQHGRVTESNASLKKEPRPVCRPLGVYTAGTWSH